MGAYDGLLNRKLKKVMQREGKSKESKNYFRWYDLKINISNHNHQDETFISSTLCISQQLCCLNWSTFVMIPQLEAGGQTRIICN